MYYGAKADATAFIELLQSAAMQAHGAVRARRDEQGLRGTMATTLTTYIGVWPTHYGLQVGDSRLICSDGLTKHVTDARIAEVLGSMTSAQQVAEQLLEEALDGGGSDHGTIIIGRTTPKLVA